MDKEERRQWNDAFENLPAWIALQGFDEKTLVHQIQSSSYGPGSDPKTALATLVQLCDAAPDKMTLALLTVQHIEALVDINWRAIREDLERAAAASPRFRAACAGAEFDDDVPPELDAVLRGEEG